MKTQLSSADIKRQLVADAMTHPTVLLPLALGISGLAMGWATTFLPPVTSFVSFCCLLVGIGMGVTRWFTLDEKDLDAAVEVLTEEAKQAREQELLTLKMELLTDRDTRTDLYVMQLLELYRSFALPEVKSALSSALFRQLEPQMEALFNEGISQLKASLELRRKAEQIEGKVAVVFEEKRAKALQMVRKTLKTLESSLRELLEHQSQDDQDRDALGEDMHAQFKQNLQRAMELDSQMDDLVHEDPSDHVRKIYRSKIQ